MLIQPRRVYARAITGDETMSHDDGRASAVALILRNTDAAKRAWRRGSYRFVARTLRNWAANNTRLRPAMLEIATLLDVEAASLATRIPDADDCFGQETTVCMLDIPTDT